MNSFNKGLSFESRVYIHLKEQLANGNLYVPQKTSQIFLKKAYYSKDRASNIITDVSIETYTPNAKEYSLLTIVECKDYSNKIEVGEIEEFYTKVTQIAGLNVKAIFATTNSLQRSALEFAKSKKIAVIRFFPFENVTWLFESSISDDPQDQAPLNWLNRRIFLDQDFVSENVEVYVAYNGFIYLGFQSLIRTWLNEF